MFYLKFPSNRTIERMRKIFYVIRPYFLCRIGIDFSPEGSFN